MKRHGKSFLLGFLTLAAVMVCFGLYQRFTSGPDQRMAKVIGADVGTTSAVTAAQRSAENQKALSKAEMDAVLKWSAHKNPFIRVKALSALTYVREPAQSQVAIRIARDMLHPGPRYDPDSLVRYYALSLLWNHKVPDIVQVARLLRENKQEATEVGDLADRILRDAQKRSTSS